MRFIGHWRPVWVIVYWIRYKCTCVALLQVSGRHEAIAFFSMATMCAWKLHFFSYDFAPVWECERPRHIVNVCLANNSATENLQGGCHDVHNNTYVFLHKRLSDRRNVSTTELFPQTHCFNSRTVSERKWTVLRVCVCVCMSWLQQSKYTKLWYRLRLSCCCPWHWTYTRLCPWCAADTFSV